MGTISLQKTASTGDTILATDRNAEFNNIIDEFNGSIDNANIGSSAAIAYSKLNLSSAILSADLADISGTVVGTTDSQTLSGKTLTKPTINASVQAFTTDSDGATVTFNMSASNVHTVTLAGDRTLAVSNVSTGQAFVIILTQDGPGSRTVTWFGSILWPDGTVPTLTTTGGDKDAFGFIYDGTNYIAAIIGQAIS